MNVDTDLSNNEYTYVDVTVEDFTEIVSFQFAMLWNPDVFKVEAVNNYNPNLAGYGPATTTLPDQTPAADDGTVRMIWFDPVTSPNSLLDGSRLFTIKFSNVGDACQSSDLKFGDALPTLVEVIDGNLNQIDLISSSISITIPGPGCGGASGCFSEVEVNPSPWNCEVALTQDQLLQGSGYENVTISPESLDMNSIGQTTNVTVDYTVNGVADQCEIAVAFVDNVPPVVVVNDNLVVSLSTDPATAPTAIIFAETVDEGSFDNCSAVTFTPEFFEFDCSDIGEQTIFLEVEDEAGNTNKAWTTVTVEYKSNGPINLTCPQDIVVDCYLDINDPAILESTLGLATVSEGCPAEYFDVFDYDANADGDINDTFTIGAEEFNERFSIGCNNGPVVRTWSVPGTTTKCEQLIVLREGAPFDGLTMIDWPYSLDMFAAVAENDGNSGCASIAIDPSTITVSNSNPNIPPSASIDIECKDDLCEMPAFDDSNVCSLLGSSIESDTFYFEGDACLKIIQTFTVIDWCNYDPITNSGGIWEYTVVAKYNDAVAPEIVAEDMVLGCDNTLSMSAIATDPNDPTDPANSTCQNKEMRWHVLLDVDNDQIFEREWSSFVDEDLNTPNDPLWSEDNLEDNLVVYGYSIPDVRVGNKGNVDNANSPYVIAGTSYSINIPENLIEDTNAQHRVVWKAYDQCGNVRSVVSYFTVDRSTDTVAPTPYCINFVTAKLEDPDGSGPQLPQIDIWAIDFDAGSFDNCSSKDDLRFTFTSLNPDADITFEQGSQSAKITFDKDDLTGESFKDYDLKIFVWDENDNSDFCSVKLRITEEDSPCQISNITCGEYLTSLNGSGFATISTDQLDISFSNPCNLTVEESFSPVFSGQKTLDLSCAEKGNTLQEVYFYVNGLLTAQCKALIKVVDPLNACPSGGGEVSLKYRDYSANPAAEICIELQVDNFEDIDGLQGTLEWDPAVLEYKRTQNYALASMGAANFGTNGVDIGKLTYLWYDLTASNPATIPSGGAAFEVCFDVIGSAGDVSPLAHSDSPTLMQVTRGSAAESLNLLNGVFTVGSSNCGPGEDTKSPTPYCINLSTAYVQAPNNEVELWAIDFNIGTFDNCTAAEDLRFTFSDVNPDLDPEYVSVARSSKRLFSIDDVDPTNGFTEVNMYVWDEADNKDFCKVNLRILENDDPCYSNTEDNIQWPLAEIIINQPGLTSQDVGPDNLVTNFGFAEADAFPTYVNTSCVDGFAQTYADVVINSGPDAFKIVRTWTVLDWYTANIYQYNQILKINQQTTLICDFLPNTAPVGDCASGHTLDDDVEWPADIIIADHRISPDELEMFSGVPSKDSRPVFYNADASLYTADYIDVLISLNTTTLVLERQWTVGRTDNPTLSWSYKQEVTVDITMFSNLVTVNTILNRPMPNVTLNDQTTTDLTGSAMVMPSESVEPAYSDLLLNGLDLRDVLHIQRQILVQANLNNFQRVAADMNNDQAITTIDIVELIKVLTGQAQNPNTDWQFIDYTNNSGFVAQVRGHYIGYKYGDVDDSAVLDGTVPTWPQQDMSFEDVLLNAGEIYEIPFTSDELIEGPGFHVNLEMDTEGISIQEISSEYFENIYWYIDANNNRLSVLAYDVNSEVQTIPVGSSLFDIEIRALTNSTLGLNLNFDDNYTSYVVTGDDALVEFNGQLEGGITLNTYDLGEGVSVKVYPNPATDFIQFKFDGLGLESSFRINILDLNGQLISTQYNSNIIDLTNLNNGVYLFQIQNGDKSLTERFVKM